MKRRISLILSGVIIVLVIINWNKLQNRLNPFTPACSGTAANDPGGSTDCRIR